MYRWLLMLLAFMLASPVSAHSLRVFAKVDGTTVSGYAFFIGGGRPDGVRWVAKMQDTTVATGTTDTNGGYNFSVTLPVTTSLAITVDTGEGHIATATLAPERFGKDTSGPTSTSTPLTSVTNNTSNAEVPAQLVEAAVERQVGPLLERIEQMDSRMRFTDIMSGIFLIIGLAGIGLWALGRKR